jgi:hypothetical protein
MAQPTVMTLATKANRPNAGRPPENLDKTPDESKNANAHQHYDRSDAGTSVVVRLGHDLAPPRSTAHACSAHRASKNATSGDRTCGAGPGDVRGDPRALRRRSKITIGHQIPLVPLKSRLPPPLPRLSTLLLHICYTGPAGC